jgi:hypothetical protein
MGFFTRFFQQNVPSRSESSRAHAVARVAWWEGTTMPIPDWTETAKSRPANADVPTLDAFWLDAARQWLDRLKTHLDGDYAIDASPHFLLLSTGRDDGEAFESDARQSALRAVLAARDDRATREVLER